MATELSIFTALNAIENDVSAYGIPTVYYAGDIFRFTGIAMTLFYGSLDKYYYLWKQKSCQCIPYSNILSIFKQMVRDDILLNLNLNSPINDSFSSFKCR